MPRTQWTIALVLIGAMSTHASPSTTASTPSDPAVHSIRQDMGPIDHLLNNHSKIVYKVTSINGGARTVTTSSDPVIASTIKLHAWEMKARMEQGNVIRPADPLFAELFRRHSEIKIQLREIPKGVVESETSTDPQVVLLIRAHTHAVTRFVQGGMPETRQHNPLPPGYHSNR